jgi:dihydroorotate dehydrogenase (NAD+) catalytic subunit
MSTPDLSTEICGIQLRNPTVLAAGVLGVSKGYFPALVDNGIGAITIKSISREPQAGHANPTILAYEGGLINAVGYSNPGLEAAIGEFGELKDVGVPVFASIIGKTNDDFKFMADNFLPHDFAAVEVALSCPHTPGYGMLAGQHKPETTRDAIRIIKERTSLPVIAKLSPNVESIAEVAKAAEEGGADAISAINSVGPGMVINIDNHRPVLDFSMGGLTGPGIRPIAVRCVYEIYKNVSVPIIGIGGITTGRDAIEMMMAGAAAVGIGSAVYYRGAEVFRKICLEMAQWLEDRGISSVKEIVGKAHE